MKNLLLVVQTPPPYHGQAIVNKLVYDYPWKNMNVNRIRMQYSKGSDDVSKFQLGKLWHLISITARTVWSAIRNRGTVLYYTPGGPMTVPVVRDFIYMICVKPFVKKLILHFHAGGLPDFLDSKGLVGKLGRMAYKNADITVGLYDSERPEGEYFNAKSRRVIANGLDIPLAKKTRTNDKFRILYLGLMAGHKGVMEVIQTLHGLHERGVNVESHMVGGWADEDIQKEAESYVKEHNLEEVVIFRGIRKGDEKWAEYGNADMFLFPSYSIHENFPLVLIESMAYGLPIVSTEWRGIPQLVADAAEVYPIKDVPAYVDAIERLINDGEKLAQMSKQARSRYENNFALESFYGSIQKMFDEV